MKGTLTVVAPLVALVTYLALGAQAFAVTDPACDPWGDRFGVHDLNLDTDNNVAFAASGVTAAFRACGTEIGGESAPQGTETLFDHFDVELPPGVEVNDAASLPLGHHVGQARVNVITILNFGPWGWAAFVYEDEEIWLWAHDPSDCESENEATAGGPRPGVVIACYLGRTTDGLGHGYAWVTRADDGGLTLTIGPFHNDFTYDPAGITRVSELTLCRNTGGNLGPPCGSSSQPWLQKNGAPSRQGCQSGNGLYSVTATNKAGETTAPAGSCVRWRIGVERVPAAPGTTSKLRFDPPSLHYRGPDPG